MKSRLLRSVGLFALLVLTCWGCVDPPPQTSTPPTSKTAVISSSPLIAMTPTEYNNTIRDLFTMPLDRSKWPALGLVNDANKKAQSILWPWLVPDEAGVD